MDEPYGILIVNKKWVKYMKEFLAMHGSLEYEVISGSHSYGTNVKDSDVDIRGVFIPHKESLFRMDGANFVSNPSEEDSSYFSIQKFVSSVINGDPNVLELIFVDEKHVKHMGKFAKFMRDNATHFVSKNIYGTFSSFAKMQEVKLYNKIRNNHQGTRRATIDRYGYDTKHAMHTVRVYDMGTELLLQGTTTTYRPNREELLDIRNGRYTLEEFETILDDRKNKFRDAYQKSTLPEEPDTDYINSWLVDTLAEHYGIEYMPHSRKVFRFLPFKYAVVENNTILSVKNLFQRKEDPSDFTNVVLPTKEVVFGISKFTSFGFDNTSVYSLAHLADMTYKSHPRALDLLYISDRYIVHKSPSWDRFKDVLVKLVSTSILQSKTKAYVESNLKRMKNAPPQSFGHTELVERFGYDTHLAAQLYAHLQTATTLVMKGEVPDSRADMAFLYEILHGHFATLEDFSEHMHKKLHEFFAACNHSAIPNKSDMNMYKSAIADILEQHLRGEI